MSALLDAACKKTDAANNRAATAMKRATAAEKLVIAVAVSAAAAADRSSVGESGDACAEKHAAYHRSKANEKLALDAWLAVNADWVAANADEDV